MGINKVFKLLPFVLLLPGILLSEDQASRGAPAVNGNLKEWKKYYNQKSLIYFDQGEYSKSAVIDSELLELKLSAKERENISARLAKSYAGLGQNEKAIEYFRKAIAVSGGKADLFYFLASSYEAVDLVEEALDCYKRCIDMDGKYSNAYIGLGRVYWKIGLMDYALANLNKALEQSQPPNEVYNLISLVYEKQNNIPKALEVQYRCVLSAPNAENYLRLGYLKFLMGDYAKALEDFEASYTKEPGSFEAPLYMGICHLKTGNLEDSEKYLLISAGLEKENAPANFFLGLLYKKKGEHKKAKSSLEAAENFAKSGELSGYINITRKELESYSNR